MILSPWNTALSVSADHQQQWYIRYMRPMALDGKLAQTFIFITAFDICRDVIPGFPFPNVVSNYCPKESYCLLKAILNRLLSRGRLHAFGILQQSCFNSEEFIIDVHFECPFSKYPWSLCRLRWVYQEILSVIWHLKQILSNRNLRNRNRLIVLSRLSFSATFWHV